MRRERAPIRRKPEPTRRALALTRQGSQWFTLRHAGPHGRWFTPTKPAQAFEAHWKWYGADLAKLCVQITRMIVGEIPEEAQSDVKVCDRTPTRANQPFLQG